MVGQRSDSIGQTVLQTVAQKRFALCYRTVLLSICDVGVFGQTVGWIKILLGKDESWHGGRLLGLGPGHTVLDGDPALPKGHPQFSAHVFCSQTAGWIQMSLGKKVGLGLGDTVRWRPNTGTVRTVRVLSIFWWPLSVYQDSRWWLEWRFQVLIGNNGRMHFTRYPEPYNYTHSVHVYFWHNLGTVYPMRTQKCINTSCIFFTQSGYSHSTNYRSCTLCACDIRTTFS